MLLSLAMQHRYDEQDQTFSTLSPFLHALDRLEVVFSETEVPVYGVRVN